MIRALRIAVADDEPDVRDFFRLLHLGGTLISNRKIAERLGVSRTSVIRLLRRSTKR
jgi:DNA-binding Lrp family transcriptional regulator